MKSTILAIALLAIPAGADDVFKIQAGKDYSSYSHSDLQRRVWELERAVWQLQQRVYQIESGGGGGGSGGNNNTSGDTWLCTIHAMGDDYTGTGGSKAVATDRVTEKCKAARDGDSFFCKDPKCHQ